MIPVLFDSNTYTLLKSSNPEDANYIVQFASDIGIPIVVLGELLAGFKNGNRFEENKQELDTFLALPQVQLLYLTQATAELFGTLFAQLKTKGRTVPHNDLWIAAIALEHNFAVYSFDKHFQYIDGLNLITKISDLLE
jgi:tRNA(fMet)-specific endonuclease VapC